MGETLGKQRIGKFNPSGEKVVDQIKEKSAELIDLINSTLEPGERSEKSRLAAIAFTNIETAAMYAVKAQFVS